MTLGDYRAYFLACVVRDRERYSEYYGKYIGSITRFAAENIEAGNISKPLALIYTHLMDEDLLFPNLYQRMLELISTVQIDTDNKLITSVLVFHREFNEYQENFLESGRANIRVHSDDAVVLFKDVTGNLYADIAHTAVPLIDKERYIDKCIENADITRYMLVGRAFERLKELKEPHAILEYMLSNLGNGQLRGSYEQSVLKDLIVRYSRSSSDSQISDRLLKFLKFDLDEQTRGRLIEVMIDRKMFKEASLEIEKSGHSGVDGTHIAALSHILAEVTDYEKDMVMDSLCLRAFEEMPYDPVIFKYMYLNYDGSIEALERIYDTAVEHEMSEIPVACRILRCSMDQDVYDKKTGEVFAAYFEKGDDTELKTDYMIRIADRYLYDRSAESEYIFPYIEESLVKDQEFPDRTVIAFLIEGRKRQLKGRILKVLEERLRDLVRRGIMLEEFKFYRKYFQIPAALANTYIAETFPGTSEKGSDEHITSSNMFHSAPVISFELNRRGKIIKGEEAMKEVAAGCYCYYFTLFYGESVIYSISKGSQTVVTYNDLQIVHDGSRYSDIDNMIRLLQHGDERCLKEALGDYYIKNELIERLF